MLRLKDIARQRELFDDMESESSSDESDTMEGDSLLSQKSGKSKRSASLDTGAARKLEEQRSNSTGSYFKDFIHDKTFDFLAYKQELRRCKLMEWCKDRQKSIKIVGKGIEPPDEPKQGSWFQNSCSNSQFSRSLDDSESLFMLPYYLKPKEEATRKILTISTLQLHRAINDRIQDEKENPIPVAEKSDKASLPEEFPFDKPKMKFVGGGGVIAKYENPFRSLFMQLIKSIAIF